LRLSREDKKKDLLVPRLTTPRVLSEIIARMDLAIDGRAVDGRYSFIPNNEVSEFNRLMDFISSPDRQLPVLVYCATGANQHFLYMDTRVIAADLAGLAHVVVVGRAHAFALAERLGSAFDLEQGNLQYFRPGFGLGENTTENPQFSLLRSPENSGVPFVLAMLAQKASIKRMSGEEASLTFAGVKQIIQGQKRGTTIVRLEPKPAPPPPVLSPSVPVEVPVMVPEPQAEAATTSAEILPLREELAALTAQLAERDAVIASRDQQIARQGQEMARQGEEIALQTELLDEQAGLTSALQTQVQVLEVANRTLTSQLQETQADAKANENRIQRLLGQSPAIASGRLFPPYKELPEWAAVVVPNLVFSKEAERGARESQYKDSDLVYQSLLLLNGPFWMMQKYGSQDAALYDVFTKQAEALGVRIGFSAAKTTLNSKKFEDEYTFAFAGRAIAGRSPFAAR